MFILSYISSSLEFWSVNHTSIYENLKLKIFEWKSLLAILKLTNTTLVASKRDSFSPFLSLVILFLVLPSNYIVSGLKSSR